ncbi:hypothetical protein J2W96_004376 [Variovorax guangxiensis]|nr:hypothetical protein [Variovorax guangxiensis]
MMRVVVDHPQKAALEVFAREIAPAGTSWAPGTTGPGGGRPSVSPLVKPFAFLLDKAAAQVGFVLDGERHAAPVAATADDTVTPPIAAPAPFAGEGEPTQPTQPVRLVRLAWARSGDKGDVSNIGLVARRPEWLPLLWARVTPEAVQAWFAHLVRGRVERFHLPGIAAMNLLLHEALDGGGPSSMRMDPLGKGMAQMLLDMEIEVPRSIAQTL